MRAEERAPLGADLVIPVLALAFAAYFFYSIDDLAWEAKANGVIIGTALVALAAIQVVRIAMAIARGKGSLRADVLWQPREVLAKRLGMVAVTIPEPAPGQSSPQSNDVDVDERGLVYLLDRNVGLDILEFVPNA